MRSVRRSLVLPGAFLMQLCLGATYSWSVFVRPIRELTGLSQGWVQLPFSVFYFAFPATMMLSGYFLRRLGPRRSSLLGGLLFGGGWILASIGADHFAIVVLGIGVLAGIGVGLAYIVPIAVCVRWFPRRKGLVTGVAVAGFGGGAALVSQIAGSLLSSWGWTPYTVFGALGVAFLLLVSLAALALSFPAGEEQAQPEVGSALSVVKQKEFRVIYLAMVTGLAAGFAVNANLKEISATGTTEIGILAVSLFAVANGIGRLIWGALFDTMKSATAIGTNLVLQAIVLIAGGAWIGSNTGFLIFAIAAGFNYGGVLVLYASTSARLWGGENVGQVYGLLFTANILAAPAPLLAGLIYDATGSFWASRIVLATMLLAAVLMIAFHRVLLSGRHRNLSTVE